MKPSFPVLDTERHEGIEPGRVVLDEPCVLEPYVPEIDSWCTLPLRIVHTQGGGLTVELGPYTLTECDVDRLRDAIRSYDIAKTGPKMRRVR